MPLYKATVNNLTALVAADGATGGFRKDSDSDARILFRLTAADLNVTTDQQFTKVGTFTNWLPLRLHAVNSSASAASAVGGVYSAASKGGAAIFAASGAFSGITGASHGQAFGNANGAGGNTQTATPYLSLTTPHGSAVTADLYVLGFVLD